VSGDVHDEPAVGDDVAATEVETDAHDDVDWSGLDDATTDLHEDGDQDHADDVDDGGDLL
jgi:hypothetical protein